MPSKKNQGPGVGLPGNGDENANGREQRPTLKTIAFMTGLGVTTVSRALSDAPDISQSTKERVRLVAQQIGYRPNRAGVRLRTGKTNVISLVMNIEQEVMAVSTHLVYGLSQYLARTPYHLIVTPYELGTDPIDPVRYIVETGSADGIILSRTEPEDPRVQYLVDHNFPFATHGRTDMGIAHPYYDFNNEAYARVGVEVMVRRGRKRLSLLGPSADLSFAQHMTAGFIRGIEENDLLEIPIRRVTTDNPHSVIQAEVERIMKSRHRPDGLICGSVNAAIAATAGIEAAGFTVGNEIDIYVKESFHLMEKFRPNIFVVHEDFRTAGQELGRAIEQTLKGTDPKELQMLETPSLQAVTQNGKLLE